MSNIKILSAVLSFLLLFTISCSNEDTTGGNGGEAGYYNSNHPPAGTYSNRSQTATVTISGDTCNIKGQVERDGTSLDYDVTVKNWYTYYDTPGINYAGNKGNGELTFSAPENVDSFYVMYHTTNEMIDVSLFLHNQSSVYSAYALRKGQGN